LVTPIHEGRAVTKGLSCDESTARFQRLPLAEPAFDAFVGDDEKMAHVQAAFGMQPRRRSR
jgi:hypothetical protein